MESKPGDSSSSATPARSACTECQRRKQKCNRQWPCNHCQKRKVADKCRFSQVPSTSEKPPAPGAANKKRSRDRGRDDSDSSGDSDDDFDGESLEALGYMPSHFFANLSVQHESKPKPARRQYYTAAASCPQLQRALLILPPRTTTDSLVQNFLGRANFHYYIIYPPSFLQEYRDWWVDRYQNKPLGLQWTCLLLNICACSTQYAEEDLRRKLEFELGESIERLGDLYHNAARELHSVIPVGNNHLLSVQQLLHSSYWYKSEARFVESWQVLNAAIREAQELGINQETAAGPMSEFDREMRRRVWCVLDTWDWQISALLSRPRIIDRSDCDVEQPSLTLEGYSPSPLLHMKLQSELIGKLAARFGLPKNATTTKQVQDYIDIVEDWIQAFPSTYAVDKPDTSQDSRHSWITLHRHYLHTMSYSMILDPLRPYLARRMTHDSPRDQLDIRRQGVDFTLKLMDKLYAFFDHLYPTDAKFHFVIFSIFDTAAVVCSTLMHDEDRSLYRRDDLLQAMDGAIGMLQRLITVTATAKTSYEVLLKLSKRIRRPNEDTKPKTKRNKKVNPAFTPPSAPHNGDFSLSSSDVGSTDGFDLYPESPNESPQSQHNHQPVIASTSPNYSSYSDNTGAYSNASSVAASGIETHDMPFAAAPLPKLEPDTGVIMAPPAPPNMHMPPPIGRPPFENYSFDAFSDEQLGELATLWNYQSLDLNFQPQPQHR